LTSGELTEIVSSLSPEEQVAVIGFIDYLKGRNAPSSSLFLQAAEHFMAEHPDLLKRLSQ
jgi:hypothetical protein